MSSRLPYPVFDCDHHYYEPAEALTRYMPEKYKDVLQYVEIKGRTKLVIHNVISHFIPNPTFAVVAAPGCHMDYYRGNNPEGKTMREMTVVEKVKPEYQYKNERRVELLEEQGIDRVLIFPTLASAIEGHMAQDPEFCAAAFHALNLWIQEEWGFDDGKFYCLPAITMMDAELALQEVQWAMDGGARAVLIRPTYVPGKDGSRSMGAREFDPVYKLLAENGIPICFHGGDSGYEDIYQRHSPEPVREGEFTPHAISDPLQIVLDANQRAIADQCAAMVCHGVYDRHPNLKVAYVEAGVAWLPDLVRRLSMAYAMQPQMFKKDPIETLKTNVWFHPHFEEDVDGLAELVGVDHVLFGSDWPHPEGLADPVSWADELGSFSQEDQAKIMGGNLMNLLSLAA